MSNIQESIIQVTLSGGLDTAHLYANEDGGYTVKYSLAGGGCRSYTEFSFEDFDLALNELDGWVSVFWEAAKERHRAIIQL
jgi:hypothetical protein